jgi:hypothetical protein
MFGYYPLLDRSGGGGSAGPVRRPYYFQVALQESQRLSGIPEYLRILAKPIAVRRAPARMFTAEPISLPPLGPLHGPGATWPCAARKSDKPAAAALLPALAASPPSFSPLISGNLRAQDAILAGENPDMLPRDELIARGAGLLQRDLNDIASALGTCTCAKEPHKKGLPYKALTDYPPGLPADEGYSELTRFALAKLGQGIIMRDLVAVADQMGECACEGRPNGLNATVEA